MKGFQQPTSNSSSATTTSSVLSNGSRTDRRPLTSSPSSSIVISTDEHHHDKNDDDSIFEFDETYEEMKKEHRERRGIVGVGAVDKDWDRHHSRHQSGLEESLRMRERVREAELIERLRHEAEQEERENPGLLREKDRQVGVFITPGYQAKLDQQSKRRQREREAAVRRHQNQLRQSSSSSHRTAVGGDDDAVSENDHDDDDSSDDFLASYAGDANASSDYQLREACGKTSGGKRHRGDEADEIDKGKSDDDDESDNDDMKDGHKSRLGYKEVASIIRRENLNTLAFHCGNEASGASPQEKSAVDVVSRDSSNNTNNGIDIALQPLATTDGILATQSNNFASASALEVATSNTVITTSASTPIATETPLAKTSKVRSIQQQYEDALAAVEKAKEQRRLRRCLRPSSIAPGTLMHAKFEQIYNDAVRKRHEAMTR